MEWRVDLRPSYSVLKVPLRPGEAVVAEPGAMVLMRGRVEIQTGTSGGLIPSLLRSLIMDEGARYQIRPFGGLRFFLFGGEGLVVEVQGPTRLWLQSRHLASLASALLPIFRKHLQSE